MALPLLKCINSSNAFMYLCLYNKNLETWLYINSKTLLPNILEAGKFTTTQVWCLVRSIVCFQSDTFFFERKFCFYFLCTCMYRFVVVCPSKPEEDSNTLELELQAVVSLQYGYWPNMRTEIGSSGRAASEFKCWAISPNPQTLIFFLFPCMAEGRRTKGFTDSL